MTDILCGYPDRDETIASFLYDELDANRRRDFNAHLLTCTVCRDEVADLRRVRMQLARWEPPALRAVSSPGLGAGRAAWWRTIPAWAQVAAALLVLGASLGIANLNIRYDQSGLSITTGWRKPPASSLAEVEARNGTVAQFARPGAQPAGTLPTRDVQTSADGPAAPWRTELAALEGQLRAEFRAAQAPAQASRASSSDGETLRRMTTMLEESEKRQQRELALRIAEVVRDVNAQRQADLRNIDRQLGLVSNDLGVEVLKQRQSLNLLYRASQRQ